MRIILTGEKGVGKTTTCKKIIELAREEGLTCCGVITSQEKEDLVVEDLSTGEKRLLATGAGDKRISNGISLCSFVFSKKGIEFGKKALGKKGDLLTIDEIGKLELGGEGFNNAISAFKSKRNKNSILVVRDTLKKDVLRKLDTCNFKTIKVTRRNREDIPVFTLSRIKERGEANRR